MHTVGRSIRLYIPFAVGAALAGCDAPTRPAPDPGAIRLSSGEQGVTASATGGGHYLLTNPTEGDIDVQFAFSAVQHASGKVMGHFHHKLPFQGYEVDFKGEVTCLAFDAEHKRAWIGGVITHNKSTHPFYMQEIFQPGHDAWFRVVDYGEGSNAAQPDRTTFIGFENTPGIPTSEFYCQLRPWPADDARTWPVTEGNIQVRVDE
jgi:hypothetical protein